MAETDSKFAGSIPAIYDRYLGPLLFQPYAEHMAERVARLGPARVLETAAGTGIVTREMARALPQAAITATDLNPGMVGVGTANAAGSNITWQVCDATRLPFADQAFDAIVCQFGVMFFPDKATAYREARRVLREGGSFLFNVWDSLEENELARVVSETVASAFPDDPPDFFRRVPHGHFDAAAIQAALAAAGFTEVGVETVMRRAQAASARDAATGFCQGTPLRSEIEKRDPGRLEEVTEIAVAAIESRFGSGTIDVSMQAIVFAAEA